MLKASSGIGSVLLAWQLRNLLCIALLARLPCDLPQRFYEFPVMNIAFEHAYVYYLQCMLRVAAPGRLAQDPARAAAAAAAAAAATAKAAARAAARTTARAVAKAAVAAAKVAAALKAVAAKPRAAKQCLVALGLLLRSRSSSKCQCTS
jgi:hypothetical protein